MKKLHPFFITGTAGMLLTAALHIFLALGLSVASARPAFFVIYPTFMAFLVIGFGLTLKEQKSPGANT